MRTLRQITATNLLSLKKVRVDLGELNVLVGPNGAGKTNLLNTIKFIGAVAKLDLLPAIESFGGFSRLMFAGTQFGRIEVGIEATITTHASDSAPDSYRLSFLQRARRGFTGAKTPERRIASRTEILTFKRTKGRGRRITVKGNKIDIQDIKTTPHGQFGAATRARVDDLGQTSLRTESAALSTLRRLRSDISDPIDQLARFFEEFEVYDINVELAKRPSPVPVSNRLMYNARNLASFLYGLKQNNPEILEAIVDDLRIVFPSAKSIEFETIGGATEAVVLMLRERPFKDPMPLEAASFGTVRALALLALLHDPSPPRLICVEEIDHGLHPLALDRVVDRMRGAVSRTQLIVATHSPALVNRLKAEELVVCERDPSDGASLIPAIEPSVVRQMERVSGLELGELWFSGALSQGALDDGI
jgi:predicted ATPase